VTDQPEQAALGASFAALGRDAEAYFDRAAAALAEIPRDRWERPRDMFWAELPAELREEAGRLMQRLLALAGPIADAVRNAPLASEADQRDVMTGTKAMRAALLLREFRSWTRGRENLKCRILSGVISQLDRVRGRASGVGDHRKARNSGSVTRIRPGPGSLRLRLTAP